MRPGEIVPQKRSGKEERNKCDWFQRTSSFGDILLRVSCQVRRVEEDGVIAYYLVLQLRSTINTSIPNGIEWLKELNMEDDLFRSGTQVMSQGNLKWHQYEAFTIEHDQIKWIILFIRVPSLLTAGWIAVLLVNNSSSRITRQIAEFASKLTQQYLGVKGLPRKMPNGAIMRSLKRPRFLWCVNKWIDCY